MQIDINTGLLAEAEYIASPNCDDRPVSGDINLIIIHNISLPPGEYGGQGVTQLFTNTLDPEEHPYYQEIHELKVSSHLFIRRDASIVQYVPFHQRAWHAGVSSYNGRERCNDYSIGIELEGVDDQPYTDEQYDCLNKILPEIRAAYRIPNEDITGHCDVAPGRKTDPGVAFDWQRLKSSS